MKTDFPGTITFSSPACLLIRIFHHLQAWKGGYVDTPAWLLQRPVYKGIVLGNERLPSRGLGQYAVMDTSRKAACHKDSDIIVVQVLDDAEMVCWTASAAGHW